MGRVKGVSNKKTLERFDKVYADYLITKSKNKSCIKFNMDRKTFDKICIKKGLNNKLHIKCVNYSIFNKIDSHDKAYCLGFLAADGCVSINKSGSKQLSVKIKSTDIGVLYFIRTIIGSDHKISTANYQGGTIEGRQINRSDCATFYIRNNELCDDLITHGITPNKTFNLKLPNIEDKFFNSWLLGFLDGDGYIAKRTNRPNIRCGFCCADLVFLNSLKDKIFKLYNIEGNIYINKNKSAQDLSFFHQKTIDLCSIMYKNSNFYLQRKFEKFAPFKGNFRRETF